MTRRPTVRGLALILVAALAPFGAGVVVPASALPVVAAVATAGSSATAVAYSPDRRTLAASGEDGTISLTDADSGEVTATFAGHEGSSIEALAFSPDGTTLASAGADSTVRLWDAATGDSLHVLHGHEQPLRALAFSADGKQLISGGEDTRILTWDVATGELEGVLGGNTDTVTAVAVSPDGSRFATATRDAHIRVWDTAGGTGVSSLDGHTAEVTSLAFATDGATLVSGSRDKTVRMWDVRTSRQLRTLNGHTGAVTAVAFGGLDSPLATGSADGSVRLWNARTGAPIREIDAGGDVSGIAFGGDGRRLSAATDAGITQWDARNGRRSWTRALPAQPVRGESGALAGIAPAALSSAQMASGPGGPILVVTSTTDPFSTYYAEILRAEGLNAFATADISQVTAQTLASYEVVLLAARSLTGAQASTISTWVTGGGNLVAMRPDAQLAGLLGITAAGSTLAEGYLLVNAASAPGAGIVGETMQFHGTADRYTLSGATEVARLYSTSSTSTPNPAVTLRSVGSNGGEAAAFTYDLARSIVATRQGNLAWQGQERDGLAPIRSDDLFFGNASGDPQADWIDLSKVSIPQADEQQRLLVNLMLHMNADRTPLPRFWYLPKSHRAAVVMTGDDHGNDGTSPRFNQFLAASTAGCSVPDWECIRGTSYIYPSTPISNSAAAAFEAQGFEIGLHVSSNCGNYTGASLRQNYTSQLSTFASTFPGLSAPVTNRTHCIAWSDWSTQAQVELEHSIRLDTNYYYWPAGWVQDRPGFFTGSAIPMRFTDPTGAMIDVYQAATQMTDESGQSWPGTIDTFLDRALGSQGYYGAFTVNAHTDVATTIEATSVVNSAKARGIPVVTARQMLEWVDGRTTSTFDNIAWSGGQLVYSVTPGTGARNLTTLIPATSAQGSLVSVTRDGSPVTFSTQVIKGVTYAFVPSTAGSYTATYGTDTTAPTVASTSPASGATGVAVTATVTATFSEPLDASTVSGSTVQLSAPGGAQVAASVTYDAATRTARLTPTASLAAGTTYTATLRGGGTNPTIRDVAGNALAATHTRTFTTAAAASCPCSIWAPSATPVNPVDNDPSAVELGVKFRSDVAGFITGVRFWKGAPNNGTHTGNLWSSTGQRLATAVFTGETASGWQQVTFSTPVAIAANTTYVASYHTTSGNYAGDNDAFATAGVDNGPLHALASGVSGNNGVYAYGSTSQFPSSSWRSSNYWVDVVFTTTTSDTTPPTVTSTSPANGATGVAVTATVTATFSEPLDASTVSGSTVQLSAPGGAQVAATVTYDAATRTARLTPTASLAASTTYTATLRGGATSPTIRDVAGNALAATHTRTFTTAAAPPADTTPPTVTATSPASGATGVAVTATVTATFSEPLDASTVSGSTVQLSAPGGAQVAATVTYDSATRTARLTPTASLAAGTTYTATLRGGATNPTIRDVAGNALAATHTRTFTTAAASSCPCSIWAPSATPANPVDNDPNAVELGVKFRSDVAGFITGVRFWKGAPNNGTHTGNLWSSTGQRLATAVFTGETASGWQQVTFSTPVAIAANTTYIASYHTTSGNYAGDNDAFATAGVDNGPLHALASGVSGNNGVYAYGSTSQFPTSSWRSSNYWVDVVFTTSAP